MSAAVLIEKFEIQFMASLKRYFLANHPGVAENDKRKSKGDAETATIACAVQQKCT